MLIESIPTDADLDALMDALLSLTPMDGTRSRASFERTWVDGKRSSAGLGIATQPHKSEVLQLLEGQRSRVTGCEAKITSDLVLVLELISVLRDKTAVSKKITSELHYKTAFSQELIQITLQHGPLPGIN